MEVNVKSVINVTVIVVCTSWNNAKGEGVDLWFVCKPRKGLPFRNVLAGEALLCPYIGVKNYAIARDSRRTVKVPGVL